MKRRRVLFIQSSQFRVLIHRILIVLVLISALSLIALTKADHAHLNKTESFVSKLIYPIVRISNLPIDGAYYICGKIKNMISVYSLNEDLMKEVQKLNELRHQIQILKKENKKLSELLNYTPPPKAEFVTAKVILGEGDGFFQSLLIYIGDQSRIKKGQVVLHEGYLIGRIESIQGAYARVLLITDINSKIPVVLERNKERGILSGNNKENLTLLFVEKTQVQEKDKLITSGVGGVFPSGLEIGYVSKISGADIEVKLINPIEMVEYVEVITGSISDDISVKDTKK